MAREVDRYWRAACMALMREATTTGVADRVESREMHRSMQKALIAARLHAVLQRNG
jgi:hypothetical protein